MAAVIVRDPVSVLVQRIVTRCTSVGSVQIRPRRCAYFMTLFAEVITPAMAATNLITSIGSIVFTSFHTDQGSPATGG